MFRYFNSLTLSLLVHSILAAAVFFSYKELTTSSDEEQHHCACCSTTINLNQVKHAVAKKTEKMPVKAQKKEQPKKIEKKPKPKPEPKIKKMAKRVEKAEPVQEPIEKVEQIVPKELNTTKDTHCKNEVLVPEKKEDKQEDYLSLNVDEIVALLKENLYYPRRARRGGIEGVVKVKFTLSKEAKITAIEVVQSNHAILSRAAVETIESLDKKLPKPDEELTLTIPINYDLK